MKMNDFIKDVFRNKAKWETTDEPKKSPLERKCGKTTYEVGESVYIHSMYGLGMSSEGYETVTKKTQRFDEFTGKPYEIIWFNKHGFYGKGSKYPGQTFSTPWAFYILLDKEEG